MMANIKIRKTVRPVYDYIDDTTIDVPTWKATYLHPEGITTRTRCFDTLPEALDYVHRNWVTPANPTA